MVTKVVRGTRESIKKALAEQVERGELIRKSLNLQNIHDIARKENTWVDYVSALLEKCFSDERLKREFKTTGIYNASQDHVVRVNTISRRLGARIEKIQSIIDRLSLFDEDIGQKISLESDRSIEQFNDCVHLAISARCKKLFLDKHYAEAVEASFKVVRDRLRDITGFETGSDAFGKTKLHIKGAAASHVEEDFNAGVKFICMAIDRFRNEKAHTSEVAINDPSRAMQYLILSSLAMRFLDRAEVRT